MSLDDSIAKCEEYHTWGVPFCWVIDPIKQTGWQYDKDREPVHVDRDETLNVRTPRGEATIHLNELFTALPR